MIRDEEQAAYDNLPDNIRESAAGDERQELIDKIEEAIDILSELKGDK